jgi:uncharacterized membrane protein
VADQDKPKGGEEAKGLPTAQLMEGVQNLISALGERAVSGLTDRVGTLTGRLTDSAESSGGKVGVAVRGGAAKTVGKAGVAGLVGTGVAGVRKAASGAVKSATKQALGGDKAGDEERPETKVTNIVEEIDVGVPVTVAYNQWTRFADFPSFMKKVEHVEQESDEKLQWKARVLWSHRTWESTIIEQVPDERIVWRSKGDKGSVDGAVTFHDLTPNLTRIVLVLEYHPQGLFERTGNLWRAQGRRARLELKHFQRHVMTHTLLHPEEVEGWRGEIRDGEVVRDHESAQREATSQQSEPEPENRHETAPEPRREPEDEQPERGERGRAGRAREESGRRPTGAREQAETDRPVRRRRSGSDEDREQHRPAGRAEGAERRERRPTRSQANRRTDRE